MGLNVFASAFPLISALIPPENISILNLQGEKVDGRIITKRIELIAQAHVQQHPKSVTPNTLYTLNATEAAFFWLVNLTPELINFLEGSDTVSTKIKLKEKIYACREIHDWRRNGWIRLLGVYNANNP